jgi:hypothetical protein
MTALLCDAIAKKILLTRRNTMERYADEYPAALEEEAQREDLEHQHQMYAAHLFGSLGEEIDELERFIVDSISIMRQRNRDVHDRGKNTD